MGFDIKKVAVVGAGIMGQGIAQSVAMSGFPTILYDINRSVLEGALEAITRNLDKGITLGKVSSSQKDVTLANIELTHQIINVAADLVIEAVVEDLNVKRELFSKLESLNEPLTIFSSNTSSLPITEIASGLSCSTRIAGLHFFNPAHIMKLVEVIRGSDTDQQVVETLTDFVQVIGKIPVQATDSPGFIVNRVARHFYLESLRLVEEQVTDYQTVDELLEAYGFKMGPFKLMDLIGIDTNLTVTKSLFKSFHYDPKFRPSRIQQHLVSAGNLGRKSGKGFYSYEL